jgi:plastocyanin
MQVTRTLVPLLGAIVVAAGCGGDDEAAPTAAAKPKAKPSQVLELTALDARGPDKPFAFDKRRLEAKAGKILLRLRNLDYKSHNIRIQTGERCCFGPDARDLGGTEWAPEDGGSIEGVVDLKPGKYWFLCSPVNHWGEGMKGRLVVS